LQSAVPASSSSSSARCPRLHQKKKFADDLLVVGQQAFANRFVTGSSLAGAFDVIADRGFKAAQGPNTPSHLITIFF